MHTAVDEGRCTVTLADWDRSVEQNHRSESRRLPLMRLIRYHASEAYESADLSEENVIEGKKGEALSVNISSGGMLLMMNWEPELHRVLKVDVPTPVNLARTPTLAQVCWKRRIPYFEQSDLHFIGVKFIV